MKKYIIGTVGVIVTIAGLALTQAHGADKVPPLCESSFELAYNVMQLRQTGSPRELVESVVHSDLAMTIVDEAYKKAIVPERNRLTVQKSFADHVQLTCEQKFLPKTIAI